MTTMWDILSKSKGQPLTVSETPDIEDNAKVIKDLKTYAFQQAGECRAALPVLKTNISKLFYNKIIDDEDFFKQEEERKTTLQKQLHEEEGKLERVQGELVKAEDEKKETENEISDLQDQKSKIKAGDKAVLMEISPPDRLGYYISIIILVFLTAYLFLFYTSAIYNAFVYNVQEATRETVLHNTKITTTIFNPNAIVDAWNKSVFTFLFIVISPIIFLGLGYLIYKFNETRKYFYTVILLAFTFFFDAVIAYSIVSAIYEGKYMTGEGGIVKPWEFKMIYEQVPFYIILAAGFVIYIVWGIVLSFVIDGHKNLDPLRSALRINSNQIKKLQEKMKELRSQLLELNKEKITVQATIKQYQADLRHEKFNHQNFEHRVAEFMSGWHNWITQGLPYEKHIRQTEADKAKDEMIQLLYDKKLTKNDEPK